MAQEEDVLLYAGVLPDLASAEKAGKELRATLEKQLYGFAADIGKHVHSTDELYSSIAKFGKSTGGMSTLYTAGNVRRAMQRLVLTDVDASTRYGASNKIVEAVSDIRAVENAVRRLVLNDPINQRISEIRREQKAEASQARQAEEAIIAREKTTQAIRPMMGIYKNVYSRSMNDEERDRARRDAEAVWGPIKENTKAIKTLTVVATGVVATGLKTFAQALPTYWNESVTRSTYGRMAAEAQRVGIVSKGVGSIGGTILGGIVGGALGGFPGAAIGASILGNVGGSVGELAGDYKKSRLESTIKSIAAVNNRYRAQGVYGGRFSVGYASAVQETGMASASDVENMTHNAATLGARMMFGQVGENEMLMYSLMPEYFAAAMSGASGAELAEAFSRSLNRLPPNLRVWVAESVGGGSLGMLAYTNSPTFGYIQSRAGGFHAQDAALMAAGAGFHTQSAVRGVMDRLAEESAVYADVAYALAHQKAGVFMSEGTLPERSILEKKGITLPRWFASYGYRDTGRMVTSGETGDIIDASGRLYRTRSRVLQTINVNIDSETIKSQGNTITEEELSGQSPTLTYTLGV